MHLAPGNNFQAFDEFGRLRPSMGLHQPHDDIDPLFEQAVAFLEHLPGFSHPRPVTEIDLQLPALGAANQSQEAEGSLLCHVTGPKAHPAPN